MWNLSILLSALVWLLESAPHTSSSGISQRLGWSLYIEFRASPLWFSLFCSFLSFAFQLCLFKFCMPVGLRVFSPNLGAQPGTAWALIWNKNCKNGNLSSAVSFLPPGHPSTPASICLILDLQNLQVVFYFCCCFKFLKNILSSVYSCYLWNNWSNRGYPAIFYIYIIYKYIYVCYMRVYIDIDICTHTYV